MNAPLLSLLALAALATKAPADLRPADIVALGGSTPTQVAHYGPAPQQIGELRLPAGKGPFPVVVLVHGGCWLKGFATHEQMRPLAAALTQRGIATWNIEYRQLGEAGAGWPGTFLDLADGTDYLRTLAKTQPLDLDRVTVFGHSAGAHGAWWIAARGKLPATSPLYRANPLAVDAVVAVDGPPVLAPLIGVDAQVCGEPVIVPLLGGTPDAVPDRYRDATPTSFLPLGVPQWAVASDVLTPDMAHAYQQGARASGDKVEVLEMPEAGHFGVLDPSTAPSARVQDLLAGAVGRGGEKPAAPASAQ